MRSIDQPIFFETLISVAELYGRELTAVSQMLYWQCLQEYELDAVRNAMMLCVKDVDVGQFIPKPADIIRQIEGGTEDRALLAWTKVEESIGRIGCYHSVVFDDPIIHAVVADIGGWINLCRITYDALPFQRNEFIKRYRGYAKSQVIPEHEVLLPGLANTDLRRHGLADEAPRLVGDPKKCQAVFKGELQPKSILGRSSNRLTQEVARQIVNH